MARRLGARVCVIVLAGMLAARGAEQGGIAQAWELMRLGRWNDAEVLVRRLEEKPGNGSAGSAWFAEGNLWQFRRPGAEPAKAAKCYQWVLDHAPEDGAAPWALLALARIPALDLLDPRPGEAIPIYRRVMADYPGSDAAQEAVVHLAIALWQARGVTGAEEGGKEIERWQAEHPNPKYAALDELVLGKLSRYPLADSARAVAHLGAALDLGLRGSAQRASTCWTIAALAETELHDRVLAAHYYTRFLWEFPMNSSAFEAKQALRRLDAAAPAAEGQ